MVGGLKPGDPQLIGPYRLVGQLGSGGMGRVFLGLIQRAAPMGVEVDAAELAADPGVPGAVRPVRGPRPGG